MNYSMYAPITFDVYKEIMDMQQDIQYLLSLKEIKVCNISYLQDYPTFWLWSRHVNYLPKSQTVGQVASSLSILLGILHFPHSIWKTVTSQS